MKEGDIVVRKSYNKDIIFKIFLPTIYYMYIVGLYYRKDGKRWQLLKEKLKSYLVSKI